MQLFQGRKQNLYSLFSTWKSCTFAVQNLAIVQTFFNTGEASPCRIAVSLIWSPAWYAQQTVVRQAPRQIGKRLLHANVVDQVGEYLIFSGTEEWSRLLISLGEAPPE